MVNWLIEASLRNRFLVLGLFVLVGAWGYWALLTTPIDAIPDLSDNQVIVFTDWTGRSPQEVEDQITYPLTVSLQGLPGVRVVRSASAFGFSMINVIFQDAVLRSNRNVGGNVVEASGSWSVVRGLGLIENIRDVEDIVVGAEGGVPIFIKQVAQVRVGDAFRAAALVKGTDEAVGGVVVARYGVSTVDVINRVKEKITALQTGLPAGVKIVSFYDRSALIQRAVQTLKRALIEETIVVTLVNVVFLLHLRSVLIVTIPLPLAVLTAFLFMPYLGISSNIMSLAGIAIAIGVLVDAGIVVTENAFRFMEKRGVNTRNRRRVAETVLEATRLVGRPIFFSLAIIILAFLPVFALTGQEGKLFHPLAYTKTFSMIGATVLSVTLVPVLCSLFIGVTVRGSDDNPVIQH